MFGQKVQVLLVGAKPASRIREMSWNTVRGPLDLGVLVLADSQSAGRAKVVSRPDG